MRSPFRYFKTSPDIIRLTVMMYVRFPLSLRQVEDLLHERGIDISYETVRAWWNRLGPMFANEVRKKTRQDRCGACRNGGGTSTKFSCGSMVKPTTFRGRTRTSDDEIPECKVATEIRQPFMPQFTITSTKNATSTAARIASTSAPPLSPSGVNLLAEAGRSAVFRDSVTLV